jgi:hypothetical protein
LSKSIQAVFGFSSNLILAFKKKSLNQLSLELHQVDTLLGDINITLMPKIPSWCDTPYCMGGDKVGMSDKRLALNKKFEKIEKN